MRNHALKSDVKISLYAWKSCQETNAPAYSAQRSETKKKKFLNFYNSKDAASKKGKVNQSLTIQAIWRNKLDRFYIQWPVLQKV